MHFNINIPNYNCETSGFFSTLKLHSGLHISTGLIPVKTGIMMQFKMPVDNNNKKIAHDVVPSEDISKKIRQ